jgi:hypothetical protein
MDMVRLKSLVAGSPGLHRAVVHDVDISTERIGNVKSSSMICSRKSFMLMSTGSDLHVDGHDDLPQLTAVMCEVLDVYEGGCAREGDFGMGKRCRDF